MPCNGCQEKQKVLRTARQEWEARAMATISEAIGATRNSNPELSKRLMILTAELNDIQVTERQLQFFRAETPAQ